MTTPSLRYDRRAQAAKYPAVLAIAERAVTALIVLNAFYGAALVMMLVLHLASPGFTMRALARTRPETAAMLAQVTRVFFVVGLIAVPITHLILTRLGEMLETVREGDPFIADNARRLHTIAFGVLGLELLRLTAGLIVSGSALASLATRIRAGFSFTPWVAVLLLFVLARVFEHGTRMRADLDGTV